MTPPKQFGSDDLERFRPLLLTLAALELDPRFRAKDDVSDIVQQTLLEAHRDLAHFRGTSEPELAGWLKVIVKRNVVNVARRYRSGKRDIRLEQSARERIERSSDNLLKSLQADVSSPSEQLHREERATKLSLALSTLPELEREAVVLKHLHCKTLAEIGRQLERPVDAVAGLLKRGLKKLRTHFQRMD
jgi:RNA polymerase sigma-70 factor (ECF subfamily)